MMSVLFFIGCFKTYTIEGQLRDTNGRPVHNAIIRVPKSEVETRSDKKGKFVVEVQYKKKLAPYNLDILALAHKSKSTDLMLDLEKDKLLEKKFILEPKVINLPYRQINIDIFNRSNVVSEPTEKPPETTEGSQDSSENTTEETSITPTEETTSNDTESSDKQEKSSDNVSPEDETTEPKTNETNAPQDSTEKENIEESSK